MDKTEEIEDIILHYLQDGCSERELEKLLGWIRESAANKEMFINIKQLHDLRTGGLYPSEEEVEESWTRLVARLESVPHTTSMQVIKSPRLMTGLLKYAASGLLFVGLTLTAQWLMRNRESAPVYATLEVSPGPRMDRLTLPDGSTVLLNSSTKLRIPDKFTDRTREVYLDGEGFFDIVHQENKPFIVHTGRQTICVTGTRFNVMDYSTDDYAITTLVSGSVKVKSLAPDGQIVKEYVLKPDQQVYLDKETAGLTLSDVSTDIDRMWMNKIYHFRDEPLQRIVGRLGKLYGVRFNIADEKMKNEQYTGMFRLDQSIDEVLEMMNAYRHFAYKIDGDTITINFRKQK